MELLHSPDTRRALLEIVLLAGVCGPLGVWVLAFRQAYAAESVAHGMLPGLVLVTAASAPFFLGVLGGAALAALAIGLAARDARVATETATAVAVGALLGAGVMLAAATGESEHLEELLFGDPLAASTTDVAVAALVAVVALAWLAAGHRALSAVAFDRPGAAALGIAPARVETGLLVAMALAVAVTARGLGGLLILALLVAPATAARRAGLRLVPELAVAAALAVVAGVAGLEIALRAGVSSGAAVALCALALALVPQPRRRRPTPGTKRPTRAAQAA